MIRVSPCGHDLPRCCEHRYRCRRERAM